MKRIFLHLVFSLSFIHGVFAGERFWVGGTGNWSDKSHWAEKSGGAPGASVPTRNDDVFFDSKSFNNDGEEVLIDNIVYCRNIIWKDIIFSPILTGSPSSTLHVYGSLAFASKMTNQFKGEIVFNSGSKGNTIHSANNFFHGDIIFDNTLGEWELLDDIRTLGKSSLTLVSGTLNTNNKNILCSSFSSSGDKKRSLVLGSSHITVREKWNIDNTINLNFDAGTSNIILPQEKDSNTFLSGNLKYNNISVTSTTTCLPSGLCTFTITVTSTQDSCVGAPCDGTVMASITGGTGPFTYLWDDPSTQTTPLATGLCIGTFLVQITDALGSNCTCSESVTNPATLNATTSQTPETCNGFCDGTATASPFGGVSPWFFSWSPSAQTTQTATGLCAGTYTVTITDSYGCTTTKTRTVTQPNSLLTNGSSTMVDCFGNCNGTAMVSPSGGTGAYTYSWMPIGSTTSAVSSLCAGTYTCTVTDVNGCSNNYIPVISEPPLLTNTVTGFDLVCNAICTGSVTATVSGGAGAYTYAWSPGGCTTSACTGLCAATYSLTVTDGNGCVTTNTVSITEPPALTIAPAGINISCFGACDGTVNANASGGTSPYTYSWSPGGCTTSACSNLCFGTYTLNITDANGCATSGTIMLTEPALLTVAMSNTDVVCPGFCNGTTTATVAGGTLPYTYAWSNGCSTSTCTGLCAGTYSVTVTDFNGCNTLGTVTVSMPSPLLTNISSTDASCFGVCDGSAVSAATGGTPPYTYAWSPGGCTTSACSNLCAGTYTLTLTDVNGCPATSTFSISEPGLLIASISSAAPNPLNCNGDCNGSAATSVSGGTPLYTYSWSTVPVQTTPSITGLCAGGYTVTVTDANGCTSATSVTFLEPPVLSVTVTPSDPTCNSLCDGSVSAVPGGGTPGYTFSWLPGGQTTSAISSLCAGNYTVTVTDINGCSNTQTVTLTAPSVLAANGAVANNVSCAGLCDGSATSSPSGGNSPYIFLWSGGQTTSAVAGLCAGSYTVTVTDANGCTDIDIITITQPIVLSSSISSTTSSCTICNGTATVTTSGGTAPYTYLWTPSAQTTSAATGLCIGTYTVDVSDANGCTNTLTAVINPVVTITITVSGTTVNCAGVCDGIATATPFGGFFPYTYSWSSAPVQTSQSATGLCAGTYSVTVTDNTGCFSTATVTFTDPPVLSASMSSGTASCGQCNGSATATPSGGTGGYTFTWSGFPVQTSASATGLCSGNYTVTVADANNCTITNTVSVGNIPTISDNPSVTLSTCGASDGAICVAPTGGTPGYTYVWSPGGATTPCITGLTAGVYTVTISDALGCSDPFAIAVGNLAGPTVTVTFQTDPTCNGDCDGLISVSVSGSNPPFNLLWSPGGQTTTSISPLCAGTYIVQVTDAVPCTSFASVTLTDPPQMSSNPVITNVSCNGGSDGSICLSPAGGILPYTFTWSPGGQTTSCITGLSAGTYTVILADAAGCDDTVSIPVTEPALLVVTISSTNVTCNGNCDGTATASVTGGTTLYTYAWSTGAPIPAIVGLCPNTYSITVTDNNGCIATASIVITEPAVLTTTLTSTNVTCNSLCDGTAAITASGGTVAYTYSWLPGGQTTPSITGLCAGNYVGTVTDANGCTSTQSVTISQPSVLSATVSTTSTSCFGGCDGTATASASGGTGIYTYLWSPTGQTTVSATGLCAGSYTLSVSDANGCVANQIFPVAEPAQLQANATTTSPSCFGGCDGTASSAPIGGTGAYTYSWSTVPVQTTSTAIGLCAGSYTLILSDGNNCSVNQVVTITAPIPLTQANGVAGATCMICNGSISIIASGGTSPYSFFWNTGATTATITGLCAGVYIDTVMDVNGCISIDTIGVSNTTGPSLILSATNATCNGFCDGTATVSATGDGPPWGYLWSFQSQTTQTATGLCANQSPFFITVTDTNGCVTVDNINITEPSQIVANATVTNATCFGLCDGSIITSPAGGTGALTYTWNTGATTASITGQCAGNYTLIITDANNCVLTTTLTIGQNTILASTVTSTNASCNASCDGTATMNVSGGTLPYTYSWCNGQTASAATGLCAGICTITVTDAIGCVRIDSAIITEPAVLSSTITATSPLCNSDCNGSVSVSVSGGTPSYTYLWMPGGCSTSSCTGLCAGTYTLTLTDANNCISTNTVVLADPPVISSSDVVTDASCSNICDGSIDITPSGGTGAYTFSWSNSAITEDITGLCAGIYSVTITDANGCSFTDSMTVGITTIVISAAGIDTSFCLGGTATLCSGSINATSVAWYNISAGWVPAGITNCITVSPAVGTYTYGIIAMNGICSDTDTVVVTVNAFPILVTSNDTTICSGDSIILCSSNATTYQWYSPLWTPVSTASCITVSPASSTVYAIIGMNGLCSDTDSVSVTVMPMPIANAGNDVAFCAGGSTQLCDTLSVNGTTPSIWWQISSPLWTPVDTDSCVIVTPMTSTDYAVIVSNGLCSDTDTVAVTIYSLPPVDAGTGVTILSTGSTVLNGSGTGTYLWSPSTGLSNTTIASPTANPSSTTTYTLTVTDINGCTASDIVTVTIIQDVVVYDGLSPNGDGINDVWEIANIELFPSSVVEVYNRWGELLFRSVGYTEKWNCKYNGSDLPVGTYYFVINLNSDLHPEPITGPITILR